MSYETKQSVKDTRLKEDTRVCYTPTRSNVVRQSKRHCSSESSSNTDEESPSDTCAKVPPWWTKEDPRLPENEKPYRLQTFVRSKYLVHLQKLLQNNYENCIDNDPTQDLPEFSELDFEECATAMEIKAVQACMVVSLYRKSMLRMIGEIRNETSRFRLYKKLKIFKKSRREAATQTTVSSVHSSDEMHALQIHPLHPPKPVQLSKLSTIPLPKKLDFDLELETYALRTSERKVANFSKKSKNHTVQNISKPYLSVNSERVENLSLDDRLVHLLGEQTKIDHLQLMKPQHLYKIDCRKKYYHNQDGNKMEKEKHIYRKPKIRPAIKTNCNLYDDNRKTEKSKKPRILPFEKEKPEELNRDHLMEISDIDNCPQEENKINKSSEDNLMKELEEMFKENENDPENEIFNICENDEQIKGIINEINKSKGVENVKSENVENIKSENIKNVKSENVEDTDNSSVNLQKDDPYFENKKQLISDKKKSANPFLLKNGKYSLWPCELHMQRRRLRLLLDAISEINPRRRDKLRLKFIMLFDEDSEDEQAIEDRIVDKVHELSCKERIATWVVSSVMPHFLNHQIESKDLFKAVSRHLAQSLIHINPYPDKEEVYNYTRNFFQKRRVIRTCQDIFVKIEDEV